jgi:hypothetical protein
MNKTNIKSIPGVAHWEPKFPFDLVVAYEDHETRNRALQLYDHLAQQLLDDYDFQCSWWKLEHLRNPTLWEQAADAAADANMVMLSLRAERELRPDLKAWLESWVKQRDEHKSALVVLLEGSENGVAHGLQPYLQNVARRAKMDFFAHTFEGSKNQAVFTPEALLQRAETVTPLLEEILQQPTAFPRWGINE